jgi:hypothetical protein
MESVSQSVSLTNMLKWANSLYLIFGKHVTWEGKRIPTELTKKRHAVISANHVKEALALLWTYYRTEGGKILSLRLKTCVQWVYGRFMVTEANIMGSHRWKWRIRLNWHNFESSTVIWNIIYVRWFHTWVIGANLYCTLTFMIQYVHICSMKIGTDIVNRYG